MNRTTSIEDWTPIGIPGLEPVAKRIVESEHNLAVLAGPGAGKTETLAQRACFLLETGRCPSPRKILAVSYKRDSAKVLRERVHLRCPEHTAQFHSVTLDSFAKHLLDSFYLGLPHELRPSADYEVVFTNGKSAQSFLQELNPPLPFHRREILGFTGHFFSCKYFLF